jgi:hypothetical protein
MKSQILIKLFFLGSYAKKNRISNFMKIRQVGTELFHAERRTDGHNETNSCFSQIWERT